MFALVVGEVVGQEVENSLNLFHAHYARHVVRLAELLVQSHPLQEVHARRGADHQHLLTAGWRVREVVHHSLHHGVRVALANRVVVDQPFCYILILLKNILVLILITYMYKFFSFNKFFKTSKI